MFLVLLITSPFLSYCTDRSANASGTIYIRADGSIDPPTASIMTSDNMTYFFTEHIYAAIVVERGGIAIDGNGYTLQGTGASWSKAMDLSGQENVTVQNTQIGNFHYGIWLNSSSNNNIGGNNITNNYYGIWLEYSSNHNSISGNDMTNNAYGIWFDTSSNNSVNGNNIANNDFGIWFEHSSNNSVSGNNITANHWNGLRINSSFNNSISCNNIAANNWEGVWLGSSSSYNGISGNNVTNSDSGIKLLSSNNSIAGNTIAKNRCGIWLGSPSDHNSVEGNTIANNRYGIFLSRSSNNTIYHNSIIYNTQHVYSNASTNKWDDGYLSGGNYWSDYDGADAFSGLHQNETGSDGVGDIPYVVYVSNIDYYPLMKPHAGPRDLGLLVFVSKTVVAQGFNMTVTVNVRIVNHGMQREIFNFTFQIGAVFTEQAIVLLGRNSTTLTYSWNTTDSARGYYVVQAYVEPVLGEADTEDNNYRESIYISVPGDVDGSRIVNMLDLHKIAANFDAIAAKPDYISNYDVDDNGTINTHDLRIAAANFGRTDP